MRKLLTLASALAVVGTALAAEPGGISGQVLDAKTGAAIANAVAIARGPNGIGRAHTNARGLYLVGHLRPGVYKVTASGRGYEPAAYPGGVVVREGEVTRDIDFNLEPKPQPEPGAIAGRVIDRRTGEPIQGAVVVAKCGPSHRRAKTDDDGRYVLRKLRPGVYRVTAKARHYAKETFPRPVPVRSGQTVEDINFALQPKPHCGGIAGRVVDARTQRPIAGAVVVALGEHGAGRAVTDRHGHYCIKRLHPGAYRVKASARGYRTESFPRSVPVHPGDVTRHIDFSLHRVRADMN